MTASTTWLIRAGLLALPVLLVLLARRVSVGRPVPLARLGRRVIVDRLVPMVLGELLALLVLLVHAVLTDLLDLSDQRVIWALSGPRVGLDHKARLDRMVMLETVVLRVNVERSALLVLPARRVSVGRPVPLALLVLLVHAVQLAKVVTSSGTRR